MISDDELIAQAKDARRWAHAPYSNFSVGAALLSSDGRVFTGCNVENSTYGLTVCAERVAIWKALSEGRRKFARIVVAADTDMLTPPCGAAWCPALDCFSRSSRPAVTLARSSGAASTGDNSAGVNASASAGATMAPA